MSATYLSTLCLGVAVLVLLVAAVSQAYARRVPNGFTIPAVIAGWALSVYIDVGRHAAWPGPAFQASFVAAFVALAIMLPLYRSGRLGAGCIKAQMAFGAWAGCALPLVTSLTLTASATVAGLAFSCLLLRNVAADLSEEERRDYRFPAQVTITAVTALSAVASWIVLR
jgi:Flp pilus assembly protein protease CpaA